MTVVILARKQREAELEAFERGIPPRGRDTLLVATDSASAANKLRGLALAREDVIETADAGLGRYYGEIRRTLEPAFVL